MNDRIEIIPNEIGYLLRRHMNVDGNTYVFSVQVDLLEYRVLPQTFDMKAVAVLLGVDPTYLQGIQDAFDVVP